MRRALYLALVVADIRGVAALYIPRFVSAHLLQDGFKRYRQSTNTTPVYSLSNSYTMPVIGLGTYRMSPGNETYSSVAAALGLGYRMFDTAELYGNEADVGRAIRDSGIPRPEIFVTTKIPIGGYEQALEAGRQSNIDLGLGYIDLLLMHSPLPGKIVETYDALVKLRDEGMVRSVGVSNFEIKHLQALKDYCRITPTVNQIQLHPLNYQQQQDLVRYCQEEHILMQAYGSVLDGQDDLLALAAGIAQAHNKSSSQVLLRWAIDLGFGVIPKSTHREFLAENLDVFDFSLTQVEIHQLNSLNATLTAPYFGENALSNIPVDVGNVGPPPAACPHASQSQ